VKQSIGRLVAKGLIAKPPSSGDGPEAANGLVEKHYVVGKRDTDFTARLVDRWQELENAAAAPRRKS
jgi:hypothetical protein